MYRDTRCCKMRRRLNRNGKGDGGVDGGDGWCLENKRASSGSLIIIPAKLGPCCPLKLGLAALAKL